MSDVDVMTERQEARLAAESFRGVLAAEGDEAFWASVREQVGDHASIEEAKAKRPVMLGALAVEYERVLASATDRQPSIEPGTLATPVSRGDCIAFAGAASTLMEMYQPDPEFSKALGSDLATQEALKISKNNQSEDHRTAAAAYVTTAGRGTWYNNVLRLLPVVNDTLATAGVADPSERVARTRTSGARLLTGLALSEERLFDFTGLINAYTGKTEAPYQRLVRLYAPDANLASLFGYVINVKRDTNDGVQLNWSRQAPVEVGCPITLMQGNVLREAWGGVVDLAVRGGYFQGATHEQR